MKYTRATPERGINPGIWMMWGLILPARQSSIQNFGSAFPLNQFPPLIALVVTVFHALKSLFRHSLTELGCDAMCTRLLRGIWHYDIIPSVAPVHTHPLLAVRLLPSRAHTLNIQHVCLFPSILGNCGRHRRKCFTKHYPNILQTFLNLLYKS